MKFHDAHGVNVSLDDGRRSARRTGSFCDAFVFSLNPLRLNSSTVVKFTSQPPQEWHGVGFLGLTSKNPTSFIESIDSKHIINLLANYGTATTSSDDVWIKQIQPQWSNAHLILSLNSDGQLEITTEYDPNLKYVFLENLPVNFPLWLIIELYGRTDHIQFPRYSSPNSREIVSLGSDIYSTYKCGESGVFPYNSARVIMIGPKSSGKTELKNTFVSNLNQESKENQASTKDFDINDSYNCLLCTNNGSDWTRVQNQSIAQNKIVVSQADKSDIFHEIAKNIVHEIVLTNPIQDMEIDSNSLSPKELIKNVLKFPKKFQRRPYSKEVKQLNENLSEIPEELMLMIEEQLKMLSNGQKLTAPAPSSGDATSDDDQNVNGTMTDSGNNSNGNSGNQENKQKYIINVSDFSGNLLYLLINQFLFTSCAVYLFVFNLADDLESISMADREHLACISEFGGDPLTVLRSIHLWISLIHSTIAGFPIPNEPSSLSSPLSDQTSDDRLELQPQVILVGTHRNSIHAEPITRNQIIKEIFDKIHASFKETSYEGHLYQQNVALDCKEMSFDEPELVQNLRSLIESLIRDEKMTGFSIPLCWMQLEQILEKFKQRGIYFVDINQLHEVVSSQIDAFQTYENLNSALCFYHNQGKIFYLDCVNSHNLGATERQGSYELGIIILDPNWFINCIYDLCSYLCTMKSDDDNLYLGIISENAINNAWSSFIDQKFILLGCLENLDLICELNPYLPMEDAPDVAAMIPKVPKLYFFPWITKPVHMDSVEVEQANSSSNQNGDSYVDDNVCRRDSSCDQQTDATGRTNEARDGAAVSPTNQNFGESTFQFVINFNILPVSLFTRLLIRLSKWSWNQGWGRKPEMFNSKGRIAVDFDHDIILKINLFQGRIYLIIVKIFEEIPNEQIENLFIGPAANVCVKVQNLIENELASLKNSYYRRLSFKLVIPCPCDAICEKHKIEGCLEESCLHFLNLHECLQKKVVECKFNRQVRTTFIQRFLPYAPTTVNNDILYESMFSSPPNSTNVWENVFQVEQLWMREAAKLLNGSPSQNGPSGHSHHHHSSSSDWVSLAKRLSYTERDVIKFSAELSPSLALLKDWYESNGRTRYCIDVLISCLRMLSREDIASLIEYELEPESVSPPIFLSYQHDSQKQVLEIRRKLELSGFPCWMDTRSISGGDSLYGKIYEGISRAKVFICCLTPRYVASPMCNREVALADVLHKPILPLIIEFTPWPPPGAMALVMSSIVYVDLCGVGSHSGTGRTQDTESRFREILDHVSRYISGYSETPFFSSRYLQLPDLFNDSGGSTGNHHGRGMHHHSRNNLLMMGNHHHHLHLDGGNGGHNRVGGSILGHHHHLLGHGHHGHNSGYHNGHHPHQSNIRMTSSSNSMLSNDQIDGAGGDHSPSSSHSPPPPPILLENDLDQVIGVHATISLGGETGGSGQTSTNHPSRTTTTTRVTNNGSTNNSSSNDANLQLTSDGDLPFSDEIISDDNLSMITRARIANRITNCSVCVII